LFSTKRLQIFSVSACHIYTCAVYCYPVYICYTLPGKCPGWVPSATAHNYRFTQGAKAHMGLTAHVVNLHIMRHSLYPLHPPLLVRTAAWFCYAAFIGVIRGKGGTAPRTRPPVVKPSSLPACEGTLAQGCRMDSVTPDPQAGPAHLPRSMSAKTPPWASIAFPGGFEEAGKKVRGL
jgi:hypothetical protein